jgi:hypothetical protein
VLQFKKIGVGGAIVVGLLICLPGATHSDNNDATSASNADVPDFVCPSAGTEIKSTPLGSIAPSNFEMPGLDELGDLARPVVRDPPPLESRKVSEFSLYKTGSSELQPRRFAFWGDSHIAAGPMMAQLAEIIRSNGVTVGTRFLAPTMGRTNVRLPVRAYCIGQSWTTDISYLASDAFLTGPALANRSTPAGSNSYLWLDLRNSDRQPMVNKIRIVYRPTALETVLTYSVDGGPEQHATLPNSGFNGRAPSEVLEIAGGAPISTIKLRVDTGFFALLGFILDYAVQPQIVLDVFGLPSSEVKGWANADPAYLAQSLHGVSYEAVVLEYGTNEGNDQHFDHDKYAAVLTAALTNLRKVFPNASCLLVGPPDRGVLVAKSRSRSSESDLLHFAKIHRDIGAVQAKIGAAFGCAFWDWQDLMGGPGGSYGWARNTPPFMGRDLTHLSSAGYKRTATALARSLGWDASTKPADH